MNTIGRQVVSKGSREIALDFLAHCFNFEIDEAIAMLGADATWWVLGNPEKIKVAGVRDRDRVRKLLETVRRGFPEGVTFIVDGVTAEGGRVAIEARGLARLANGGFYNNQYHFLIEVRDGHVMRIREYLDTQHAYEVQIDGARQ